MAAWGPYFGQRPAPAAQGCHQGPQGAKRRGSWQKAASGGADRGHRRHTLTTTYCCLADMLPFETVIDFCEIMVIAPMQGESIVKSIVHLTNSFQSKKLTLVEKKATSLEWYYSDHCSILLSLILICGIWTIGV